MNLKLSILAILATLGVSGAVMANEAADNKKWIDKCVADNADQKQTGEVVKAYCECMNDKMSSDETKSITEWEKTHKAEEEACSKKAGWIGK